MPLARVVVHRSSSRSMIVAFLLRQRVVPALVVLALLSVGLANDAHAQFNNRWLAGGSLHSWYSEIGGEV